MKVLLSVAGAFAVQATDFPTWEEYKAEYGLSWNGDADKAYGASYASNLELVGATNAAQSDFELGVNRFTFLPEAEFIATFTGERAEAEEAAKFSSRSFAGVAASDVDWSQVTTVVNPVKDQASCGSCWAFAAVGATEMSYAIDFGELHDFAEQQLVDCETNCLDDPPAGGCGGGLSRCAWQAGGYFPTKGVCLTKDYGKGSYEAISGTCRDDGCTPVIKPGFIVGFVETQKSFDDLKLALNERPMKVSVHADSIWSLYKSGIAQESTCYDGTNHAVIAVGYGSDYFKIRNSWGKFWGEGGHIRISPESACSTGPWAIFYRTPVYPQWSAEALTV